MQHVGFLSSSPATVISSPTSAMVGEKYIYLTEAPDQKCSHIPLLHEIQPLISYPSLLNSFARGLDPTQLSLGEIQLTSVKHSNKALTYRNQPQPLLQATESPINLTCMSPDCGKKLVPLEGTHSDTKKTCRRLRSGW